jgi:hypothetical protein
MVTRGPATSLGRDCNSVQGAGLLLLTKDPLPVDPVKKGLLIMQSNEIVALVRVPQQVIVYVILLVVVLGVHVAL